MRLVYNAHLVRDLVWSDATRLDAGVLSVDRAALARHLLEDTRLAAVDLEVVHPGERCRIAPVFDIVEPRCKADPAKDFPGVLGPVSSAGDGSTTVLRGMAVTMLGVRTTPPLPVLDLLPIGLPDGGGQIPTRYEKLVHLAVVPRLAHGLGADDADNALRRASLRAGVYLARAASAAEPATQEVYELTAPTRRLPRIAYVYQLHSHQNPTVAGEPILYGDNVRHLLPVVLHPNEVLDGAILPGYGAMGMETYGVQNHPVVLDLYRRHGQEVDFAGVVATVAHQTIEERERATMIAANLVRYALHADGAVLTKSGGGAPHVDMAEVARRCEHLGVKTVPIAWETSSDGDASQGAALFNHPELNAVVNVGSNGFAFTLPPADRVITSDATAAAALGRSMRVNANRLCGVMDQLGGGYLVATRY